MNHFGKIMFKFSNLKRNNCHLLYISKTTELIPSMSKHMQILYNPGNSTGHWVYNTTMASPLIFMTA